jgi:ABC-2 type transport system permease protein
MNDEKQASLEGNVLPSSILQIGIITRYEMRNYFRSRRFLVLLILILVIAGLLTFAIAYRGISNVAADALGFYSTWWGIAASFVIVISAIFFGGDAISGEFQNKTGYFLVGKPIRRSSIYIGKWIAALVASLIIIAIFTAITVANAVYYFGGNAFPSQFGESLIFSLVYLIAALGFTFLFSSVFKSSSMSILVAAIMLLFGFSIISDLSTLLVNIEPWFVLTYGAGIISDVLTPGGFPAHKTVTPVSPRFSLASYHATIPEGLAIMLIYFVVTSALGLYLFERKEFN